MNDDTTSNNNKNGTPQSKGGIARAQSLSPEERKASAKSAALARWGYRDGMPEASHEGVLPIGDIELEVYVLEDRRRLFAKRGIARALGLKSEGGNAFMKTLSGKNLGSNISLKLWEKINNPIVFKPLTLDLAHGYEGAVLIDICDAIIRANNEGKLLPVQQFLAYQAEIIIRASAKLGIVALIDEATGYSDNKRKDEYRELFRDFIRNECKQWEQEYPDRFFDMLYRLYGLKRKDPTKFQHPRFFGNFIRKYIYYPLAYSNGAILEELDKKNPIVYANGRRKYTMTQFLTEQVGLPALRQHLWQVIGIGSSVADKEQFDRSFYTAFPEAIPRNGTDQFELFPIGL